MMIKCLGDDKTVLESAMMIKLCLKSAMMINCLEISDDDKTVLESAMMIKLS